MNNTINNIKNFIINLMNNIINVFIERLKDNRFKVLIFGLLILLIGLLLPIYKISLGILGTVKVNFIYNSGKFNNGVIILLCLILVLIILLCNKDKFALIPALIMLSLFIDYTIKLSDKNLLDNVTIGYYLDLIGIITSIVCILLLSFDDSNKVTTTKPKVIDAKYEEI